ncbi:hypothetical protein A6R68_12236 [Neotoma lepida]|uniref:Uncharacterized protein n=1 Tax=Neotoma lepida TaxID=56216 RepID=A0A1A6H6E8_NEOLE|nr:hypothetical protein A6R68_00276 [Neotoma lepida]OBS73187.1 hypothetical protein A6R68_12236 [Neotoma lepida]
MKNCSVVFIQLRDVSVPSPLAVPISLLSSVPMDLSSQYICSPHPTPCWELWYKF